MRYTLTALVFSLSLCVSARAIVGDAEEADWRSVRPALKVYGPSGTCTGAMLGPDLALTAAHCVTITDCIEVAGYVEVAGYGTGWVGVAEVVLHPRLSGVPGRPTPDLAMLKLSKHLPAGFASTLLGTRPAATGERLIIVGYGSQDDGKRDSTARMATLKVTSYHNNMLVLTDQDTMGERATRGGCNGDSGGPVFAVRGGAPFLVGIVTAGRCGSATYVTPLAPYHAWIAERQRESSAHSSVRDAPDPPYAHR